MTVASSVEFSRLHGDNRRLRAVVGRHGTVALANDSGEFSRLHGDNRRLRAVGGRHGTVALANDSGE